MPGHRLHCCVWLFPTLPMYLLHRQEKQKPFLLIPSLYIHMHHYHIRPTRETVLNWSSFYKADSKENSTLYRLAVGFPRADASPAPPAARRARGWDGRRDAHRPTQHRDKHLAFSIKSRDRAAILGDRYSPLPQQILPQRIPRCL